MDGNERTDARTPRGELVIKTLSMPADTNPSGDIFGGWLLSQMDIGGGIMARKTAGTRVTTVAITGMRFWTPVHVGDTVCVFAELLKIGRTSMTFSITAWVLPFHSEERNTLVTEAIFTYVAIDSQGKPVPVKREE
jgi:acyl-CoA thioesterase YciA